MALRIETFGTATADDAALRAFADGLLDLSVKGIVDGLGLRRPLYRQTAAYWHFGKSGLPWEAVTAN